MIAGVALIFGLAFIEAGHKKWRRHERGDALITWSMSAGCFGLIALMF